MDLHIKRSFSGSVGSVVLGQSIRPSIRLRRSVNACLLQHSLCFESPRDFCTASCTHVAKSLQSPGREEGCWCDTDSNVLGLSNELKYKNKTPLSNVGGEREQESGDQGRTWHSLKAKTLFCFLHTFS